MRHAASYFSRRRGLADFISAGPLAPVLDDLAAVLEERGNCPATIAGYLRASRHVTFAIERHQLGRRALTPAGLREFARTHGASCRCPHAERAAGANFRSCMAHLLPILRRHGFAPAPRPSPFAEVLADLGDYLADVKGVTEESRQAQLRSLERLLRALMPRGRFDPDRLTAAALQRHVSGLAERSSLHSAHRAVGAIRGLLRMLQTRGLDFTETLGLLKGPRIVASRSSKKALTVSQLRALLAPLRGDDPLALRDLAIVLLLGQVGLRRSDIARLQLQDFNARASVLTLRRSKSRRAFELPVPEEARDAVLRYVRHGRPDVRSRALFVTLAFPYDRGISPSAISAVVARTFRRSGIQHPSHGAHVLRHTLATQLVAAKQPLKAVADVMRHREIDTTATYVRADLERLRAATMPWPGEANDGDAGTA